jgi:hypothetical protein
MAMNEEKEDVRNVGGWPAAIIRRCLKRMGVLADDNLDVWPEAGVRRFSFIYFLLFSFCYHFYLGLTCIRQPATNQTNDSYPHVYEQSIDLLACALEGTPPAFQYIPSILASYDWRPGS